MLFYMGIKRALTERIRHGGFILVLSLHGCQACLDKKDKAWRVYTYVIFTWVSSINAIRRFVAWVSSGTTPSSRKPSGLDLYYFTWYQATCMSSLCEHLVKSICINPIC